MGARDDVLRMALEALALEVHDLEGLLHTYRWMLQIALQQAHAHHVRIRALEAQIARMIGGGTDADDEEADDDPA